MQFQFLCVALLAVARRAASTATPTSTFAPTATMAPSYFPTEMPSYTPTSCPSASPSACIPTPPHGGRHLLNHLGSTTHAPSYVPTYSTYSPTEPPSCPPTSCPSVAPSALPTTIGQPVAYLTADVVKYHRNVANGGSAQTAAENDAWDTTLITGLEEMTVVAVTFLDDQLTLMGCLMDGYSEHGCDDFYGDVVYDFVYDLVLVDQSGNEVQQICVGCTSASSDIFFGTWTPSEDLYEYATYQFKLVEYTYGISHRSPSLYLSGTSQPSARPSPVATYQPSASHLPTAYPTYVPSLAPTYSPSPAPTYKTVAPTRHHPTAPPSMEQLPINAGCRKIPRVSASMSTIGWGCGAELCIDNSYSRHESCYGGGCHTNEGTDAWLQIDFGASYDVDEVYVFNRANCCWGRLDFFEIWVGETSGSLPSSGATRCSAEHQLLC